MPVAGDLERRALHHHLPAAADADVVEGHALRERRNRGAGRNLALLGRVLDAFDERCEGALLGDQGLGLALRLVQVVEGLEAQEEQHEGALDRHGRVVHPHDHADQEQRPDDRLLQREHRLLGEDALRIALCRRRVSSSRIGATSRSRPIALSSFTPCSTSVRRVISERSDCVWRRPACPDMRTRALSTQQRCDAGEGGKQGRLPGDGQREPGVEERLHDERRDLREVVEGDRGAVRLARHRRRDRADGLARVVGPARGEQRAQQIQPQIGRGPRDGVTHLPLREQHQAALEPEGRGHEPEERAELRLDPDAVERRDDLRFEA